MCTDILEQADINGSAKGPSSGAKGWLRVSRANVTYDHPQHAPFDHALSVDFVDAADPHGERIAIELGADSARELVAKILAALASGKVAHL